MNKLFFFICLVFVQIAESGDIDNIERGKKLHNTYCEVCHTIEESETNEESTLLIGQNTVFLKNKLIDIALEAPLSVPVQGGDQGTKIKGEMIQAIRSFLDKEGEVGLNDLLSFYASQQR